MIDLTSDSNPRYAVAVQLLSRYQSHIALLCVAILALDLALPGLALPAALSHALVAVAAALGVSRPSEAAARLAAARGVAVALGLAATVAAEASVVESDSSAPDPAVEPAAESDDGDSSGSSSSSSGGESSSG